MRKSFIFTDKTWSEKSILSALLGLISVVSEAVALQASYAGGGKPQARLGMVILLCFIFSLVGEICGIVSRLEKDRFYLFANIGIFLNAVGLIGVGVILFG